MKAKLLRASSFLCTWLVLISTLGCSEAQAPGTLHDNDAEGGAPHVDQSPDGGSPMSEDGGAAGAGQSEDPDDGDGAGGAGEAEDEADCEFNYSKGHGDLFVSFDDGLTLTIRSSFSAGAPETLMEPGRVCVMVPGASYALAESMGGAPYSEAYAFLGVDPGQPFWLLPQTARKGMPWFGVSTEGVPSAVYDDEQLELALAAVDMPDGGSLSVWSTDTFGEPSPIFSTTTGKLAHSFPSGAHVHFNWAFSAPGTYTVSLSAGGRRQAVHEASPQESLRFVVQP